MLLNDLPEEHFSTSTAYFCQIQIVVLDFLEISANKKWEVGY